MSNKEIYKVYAFLLFRRNIIYIYVYINNIMKKCPMCGRVLVGDEDAACIDCSNNID